MDRYGTRAEASFMLLFVPAIAAGIYALMRFTPRIDPGRENYENFDKAYREIRFVILAYLAVIHVTMLLIMIGMKIDIGRVDVFSLGVLLIVIGAISGKIRPNWFVGFRTPWTLTSKLSWTHSQRAAGWMSIAVGLFALPAAFLPPPWNIGVVLAAIILGTAGIVVYSYLLWRKDRERISPAGTTPAENKADEKKGVRD